MPAENIASATLDWNDDNQNNVDCFEDIQMVLDASQEKVTLDKILLSPKRLSYILRNKKMKQVVLVQINLLLRCCCQI